MHTGDAGLIAAAIPVMEDIVNNGGFSLMEKYEDNHLVATRNNTSLYLKFSMPFQVVMIKMVTKELVLLTHIYLLGDVVDSGRLVKIWLIFIIQMLTVYLG